MLCGACFCFQYQKESSDTLERTITETESNVLSGQTWYL